MNALISIVIPTYNHADFLKLALVSVLNQTYQNWEALVVNNYSEDNTSNIISDCNDDRIREIKIHNNGVIAASRNLGINESKGEWIAFLDSDDRWYPDKLKSLYNVIKEDTIFDVLCHDELMVNKQTDSSRVLHHGPFQKDFYKVLLVGGNRLSPSATMIRRDFLLKNKLLFSESQNYITVEDYDLWLNLARRNAKFKFISDVQGEYLIHGDNCSAQLSKHWGNCENLLRDHVYTIQQFEPSRDKLWRLIASRLIIEQARQYFARKQFLKAFKLTIKTFITSPKSTAVYFFSKTERFLRRI